MNEIQPYNGNVNKTDEIISNMWKRPGGGFAKITGVMLLCGLGYLFYLALPALIAFTTNILILIGELVALAGILFLLTNKDVHRWIQLMWLQLNRKVYGYIVNIDPISILENGIRDLKKKLDLVRENVTKLTRLLVGMEKKLKDYQDDFEMNVERKKSLEKQMEKANADNLLNIRSALQLANNNIARGEKKITAQKERIEQSKKYLKIMKQLEIAADFRVQDSECELRDRKDEYEQAKAQMSAVSAINSIIKGGFSRSLEEELAIDQVTTTINDSIAEMNRLLDGSNDILVNFETDSSVNASKADAILKKFEEGGFGIFEQKKISEVVEQKYISAEAEPVLVEARTVEPAGRKYFE